MHMADLLAVLFGVVVYALLLVSVLYAIVFVADVVVPWLLLALARLLGA